MVKVSEVTTTTLTDNIVLYCTVLCCMVLLLYCSTHSCVMLRGMSVVCVRVSVSAGMRMVKMSEVVMTSTPTDNIVLYCTVLSRVALCCYRIAVLTVG